MNFGFNKKNKGKQNGPPGNDDLSATSEFEKQVDETQDVLTNIDKLLDLSKNLSQTVQERDLEPKICGC